MPKRRNMTLLTLLEKEMFYPLKNKALFKAMQVEQGGHAVVWNTDIDISEYELWRKAI